MAPSTTRQEANPVNPLLSGTLRTVPMTTSLRGAAEVLASDGIGLLVVVNTAGDLAGVVSERDLVAAVADGVDLDAERVGNVMADQVVTIDVNESIGVAGDRMVSADVRHLVVVDTAQRPVGVVSARDVMRHGVDATTGVS